MSLKPLTTLLLTLFLSTGTACTQVSIPVSPNKSEGNTGIAAQFPGDQNIASHPAVVFVETFETENLEARWESIQNAPIMSFSSDRPANSAGKQSLLMTHIGGKSTGGHLYRRLPSGHEQLYLRFYVKFDPDCFPIHHFVHMGGYNPPTPYPQGGAGVRPEGDKRFTTGIEPHGDRWVWDYYAYWTRMRGSPPRGQTWGNSFIRDPNVAVKRGEWICVELMMKMNDIGDTNGEMALWIDGKHISHLRKGHPSGKWIYDKFMPGEGGESIRWNDETGGPETFQVPPGGQPFEGFLWRTDKNLNINFLWLLFYTTRPPDGHISKVYFDDVVLATQYIGPIAK